MSPMIKIIVSMVIWGSIGIFVNFIKIPSMELAFLRAVIAALVLGIASPLLSSKEDGKHIRRNLPILIFSGVAIGVNWIFLFTAYKYTTIANATLSYYFAPVFIVLLSPFIFKERLTKIKIASLAASMLGLFLILSNQSNVSASSSDHIKGIFFGIMAASLYAGVVILNKFVKGLSGYMMTLIQISAAALVLLPFVVYRSQISFSGIREIILVIIVGIVHTGLAYVLYFSAIKDVKVQTAAILSYIDPITAVMFGTIFLIQPINLYQIIGGILILGATFAGNR